VNESGKEAVEAIFGPGDFLGEGSMAGQTVRMGTATAISPTTVLFIERDEMLRALHAEHELSDRFITCMQRGTIGSGRPDRFSSSPRLRRDWPALCCCSLWRKRPARGSNSENLSGNAGGNDWHDPFSGEFVHEQVQETGFIEYEGVIKVNKSR
jgi:hypothetical protein